MSESTHSPGACPKCGATLPSAATAGLCPRCLMAEAMIGTQADAEPSAAQKALTPAELAPHFPQFEILECLGRGGMGVVYKARQKTLNRVVALKLLAPERVADAKFAQRFTHEAQALAALNHPNIVTIYDFGQAGGFYFLLMEFVDGVNLRQAMKAGHFTPEQALAIVPPVCEALQYAHEHGIVHRDIKPENLLLDREGRVKIADFGIAKMLGSDAHTTFYDEAPQAGTLASAAGTPQYMAPEQKAHRGTDHRADIYSLGVVLYELLTGELPADKLQPPSRKVQIDVRLDEIVLRALEKTPELRYQTAGDFRTQVEAIVVSQAVTPAAASVGNSKPSRISRMAIGGACWILFMFALVPLYLRLQSDGGHAGPAWLAWLAYVTMALGFTAPFGTTILGWIAVSQIRRSAGSLYGLGLAVFDGLLFPLLALDGLIFGLFRYLTRIVVGFYANPSVMGDPRIDPPFLTRLANDLAIQGASATFVALATVIMILVVDFFIVRAVWRAVNRAQATPVTHAPAVHPQSRWQGWDVWVIGLCLAIFGALWLLQLSEGPLLNRSLFAGAGVGSNVVLPIALATTILLAGAAFLWMLAKSLGTHASIATTGRRILGRTIVPVIAVVVLLRTFFVQSFEAATDAAAPEIPRGSYMLTWKLAREFAPGDMIVYWHESRPNVGRVASSESAAVIVERNGSRDFRVPRQNIVGKVISVLWRASAPSGVTRFDIVAVSVTDNIVVVDVTTEVTRGNAELRAVLDGPELPAASEAALAGKFSPPFTGTLVKPMQDWAKQPSRTLSPGRQTWRLGFVLPDAALAKAAFEDIRPIGALPAMANRTAAGTLFMVRDANREEFHASLHVSLPITPANPNWVSVSSAMSTPDVSALSSYDESGRVIMKWEVQASQPGIVFLHREGGQSTASLRRDPKTKLYQAGVSVELTKVGTDRVLLVTSSGGILREELRGNFRELSAELWASKNRSATTVRGTEIELCRFQGKPISVQVPVLTTTVTSPATVYPGTGMWVIGLCVIGGIVLIVWLWRKGGTAGKVVALLCIVPLLLLGVVLVGYLSMRAGSATDAEERAMAAAREQGRTASTHIEFKVLRVENPPGTRDIFLHFERDKNPGLGLEVTQDVTPSPGLRKQPEPGTYRDWQVKTWVGVNDRVLGWTLPQEFTAAEVRAVAKDMEQRAKSLRQLPDGAVPEFATAVHRDGWKYHLIARVLRAPGSAQAGPAVPASALTFETVSGEAEANAASEAARPSSAAPPDALFSVEQPVVVGGDMMVRVRLLMADKDGKKQPLDEEIIFKTAKDRATGFVLRWHAYGDKHPQQANGVLLHLVDPDTGVILHSMEGGFGSGLRLTSPDNLPLPAKNKSHLLARPGVHTSFHLIRAETPAAPGAPITDWKDLHAEVSLINPANERPVPAFQMPTFAPKTAPPAKAAPAVAPLIRREERGKTRDGRDFVMTFEELQRDEKTSTVRVKTVNGGSVGSAMFEVRGNWEIAKARGAAYFINLKSWQGENGEWMSLIGFAPNKDINPQEYFGLKEPLPDDPKHRPLRVSDYDRLFKAQP